ncbi:MAG: YqaE/Pmp3 family membrane protein [Burkholderiales bacterium]|nr:YqaE/Pmp3 family membrane protein [Opitutaceae bacterium]
MTIVEILLCIFLPPVAVALRKGAGKDLLINLVLWILTFGILGIVHAFWLLSKKN